MIDSFKLFAAMKNAGMSEKKAFAEAQRLSKNIKGSHIVTKVKQFGWQGSKDKRVYISKPQLFAGNLTNQCLQVVKNYSNGSDDPLDVTYILAKLEKMGRATTFKSVQNTLYYLVKNKRCKKVADTALFYI